MHPTNVTPGGRQIVAEPGATISSREAAALLGCSHAEIVRRIGGVLVPRPDLDGDWFRRSTCRDARGARHLVYEMTRDGFTLLAMEQRGRKAANLMLAIDAVWNLVEATRGSSEPYERQ